MPGVDVPRRRFVHLSQPPARHPRSDPGRPRPTCSRAHLVLFQLPGADAAAQLRLHPAAQQPIGAEPVPGLRIPDVLGCAGGARRAGRQAKPSEHGPAAGARQPVRGAHHQAVAGRRARRADDRAGRPSKPRAPRPGDAGGDARRAGDHPPGVLLAPGMGGLPGLPDPRRRRAIGAGRLELRGGRREARQQAAARVHLPAALLRGSAHATAGRAAHADAASPRRRHRSGVRRGRLQCLRAAHPRVVRRAPRAARGTDAQAGAGLPVPRRRMRLLPLVEALHRAPPQGRPPQPRRQPQPRPRPQARSPRHSHARATRRAARRCERPAPRRRHRRHAPSPGRPAAALTRTVDPALRPPRARRRHRPCAPSQALAGRRALRLRGRPVLGRHAHRTRRHTVRVRWRILGRRRPRLPLRHPVRRSSRRLAVPADLGHEPCRGALSVRGVDRLGYGPP